MSHKIPIAPRFFTAFVTHLLAGCHSAAFLPQMRHESHAKRPLKVYLSGEFVSLGKYIASQ